MVLFRDNSGTFHVVLDVNLNILSVLSYNHSVLLYIPIQKFDAYSASVPSLRYNLRQASADGEQLKSR